MKKSENIFQKMFSGIGFTGSSRIPLRSNIFRGPGSRGYSHIGGTGGSRFFDNERESPLLGNAQPSSRISGYLDRMSELKSYYLLDVTKLATNFFSDYIIIFLIQEGQQVVTILNEEDNTNNESVTERINNILTKDLKLTEYIKDHINDYVFYGGYYSLLSNQKDDKGHLVFRSEELNNPNSVIIKRKKNKDGIIEEIFLAIGDDGNMYEIPSNEIMYISNPKLRLTNDLDEGWKDKKPSKPKLSTEKDNEENRNKVRKKESYLASEPLFYSSILKIKELVIKELLVTLISLRDLSTPQLLGLQADKNIPIETMNELCGKVQKLANNYNELGSFLTAQFDITSFIESSLTQNVKAFPDYNGTITSRTSLLPLDKLSDKILDLMQNLDYVRNSVLSPLGLPSSILDGTSGSKWQVLQQSERANSRVSNFISGIKDSVISLVCSIYKTLYNEELDPSLIQLHLFSKTTVEYNNQINEAESVSNLVQGISGILTNSLQALEQTSPLLNPDAFISYIQNLLKDIDPGTESLINEDSIKQYIELLNMKIQAQREQLGINDGM